MITKEAFNQLCKNMKEEILSKDPHTHGKDCEFCTFHNMMAANPVCQDMILGVIIEVNMSGNIKRFLDLIHFGFKLGIKWKEEASLRELFDKSSEAL